jgi:hypothetical protein
MRGPADDFRILIGNRLLKQTQSVFVPDTR